MSLTVKLLTALKKGKFTVKELAEKNKKKQKEIKKALEEIEIAGYVLQEQKIGKNNYYFIGRLTTSGNTHFISGIKERKTHFKWALLGDTHLNSWHCNEEALHQFYKDAADEGVKLFLHAGDLQEGNGRMYKTQLSEIKLYGYDKTVDYCVENYPKIEGLETLVISGNHDNSWFKTDGADIVKAVCNERSDLKYLGMFVSDVVKDGVRFRLLHPEGGGSYARSYVAQKYIRNLMPDDSPDVLIYGHLHQFLSMNEQGIEVIGVPSFQTTTPYLARKGIQSQVGGLIVDFEVKDGMIQNYVIKKLDYK